MKEKELSIFDKVFIGMIPFTIVLAILLYFITGNSSGEAKSIVIGGVTALILNYWNCKMTFKISENDYTKLKKFSIISFIIRYSIMIALIVISIFTDFNPIFLFFGFLEYPLLLFIISLFSDKEAL